MFSENRTFYEIMWKM